MKIKEVNVSSLLEKVGYGCLMLVVVILVCWLATENLLLGLIAGLSMLGITCIMVSYAMKERERYG